MTALPSKSLQEDLLILLCFDNARARTLRGLLEPEHFDALYRTIVEIAIRYIDQYGDAPGDALPVLTEHLTKDKDSHTARAYTQLLTDLFSHRENVNAKFAIDRLHDFVRRQNLRSGILDASELLRGEVVNDDRTEEAERILMEAMRRRIEVFEPGTFLGDPKKSLRFLDPNSDLVTLPTGIPELDSRSAGPVRGGLHLFIAPAKAGKTQWLTNLGKHSVLQRLRVVHVSLEMEESRVARRYAQAFYAVTSRSTPSTRAKFELNELNQFVRIYQEPFTPRLSFDDADIRENLKDRIEKLPRLNRLVIKEFPTGSLTIRALHSYLDLLADTHGFSPDLLLLDYADLMRFTDTYRDFRLSLGNLYKELRGLAAERNIAVATVSQSNRSSSKSGRVGAEDVAEDWSKIATADTVLAYASTIAERELGLARIMVAAGRNDEDKFTIVISQHYASGQFCLESTRFNSTYDERVKEANTSQTS